MLFTGAQLESWNFGAFGLKVLVVFLFWYYALVGNLKTNFFCTQMFTFFLHFHQITRISALIKLNQNAQHIFET